MNEQLEHEQIEADIHELLTGGLAPDERAELLERIARDESVRRLAGEMARFQRLARRGLGLEVEQATLDASCASVLQAIESGRVASEREVQKPEKHRPAGVLTWAMRAAAVLAVAVGVVLASSWHRQLRDLRRQLAESRQSPSPPAPPVVVADLKTEDMQVLRTLWREVVDAGDQARTWVLLTDGSGEFGRLEKGASAPPTTAGGLTLVRCIVLTDDRQVRQVSILLPASQPGQLSVPSVFRVLGEPMDIALQTDGGFLELNLQLAGARRTGLRGRIPARQEEVRQVGQFRVGERTLTVYLQALSAGPENS